MRRLLGAVLAAFTALLASAGVAHAYPNWGDSPYPDPAGFCTSDSPMTKYPSPLQTNDPTVANNPEKNTFWGIHPNPGYDWWYVRLYGDFRGTYDDDSGWVQLFKVNYPNKQSWNLPDRGWSVHGHVTQYIAYYNWTFGGRCGFGAYWSRTFVSVTGQEGR